jgi:long-chain fatty acid transport protein
MRNAGGKGMKTPMALIVTIIVSFIYSSVTFAGGFWIYDHDAAASGMGLAYTAQADRPSTVFYNPAGINQLEGTNVSAGGAIIIPRTTYRNPSTGRETDMEHHTFFLPNFFVTHKISDKFAAGFGFYCPFGLTTDWPDNWEGRYISTFAELKTYFFNPVISWQVHPKLSLAGGVEYVYSELKLERATSPLIPAAETSIKGYGQGLGFNLGLLYHVTEDIDLGISYRSRVDIDYDGKVRFYNTPPLPQFQDGDVSVNLDLPSILAAGLAIKPFKNWTFEFDVFWVDWSTFDELSAGFENPNTPDEVIPRDWHDTFSFAIGTKYQLSKSMVLRGGYMFDPTPVPKKTLDPILPDSNRHMANFGVGYQYKGLSLDAGYKAIFYENRSTTSNIQGFNGEYESFAHLVAINMQYAF